MRRVPEDFIALLLLAVCCFVTRTSTNDVKEPQSRDQNENKTENLQTVGDVSDCLLKAHDDCSASCIEKLPSPSRDGLKKCFDHQFTTIHVRYKNCMSDNGVPEASSCFKTPTVARGPLRKQAGTKIPNHLTALLEFKECEEECMDTVKERCSEGCDNVSTELMDKLRQCAGKMDFPNVQKHFTQCIMSAYSEAHVAQSEASKSKSSQPISAKQKEKLTNSDKPEEPLRPPPKSQNNEL